MATIGSLVLQTMTDYALDFYVRGPMTYQTNQDKPLLRFLEGGAKTFPAGKTNVSLPVKGTVMNDTSGFFAGITFNSQLVFTQMALGVRATYPWKTQHAGFVIDHEQLKQDGISVVDGYGERTSDHGDTLTRLTGILQDAMEDYGESYARAKNLMYWQDGSQDSSQIPGVKSIVLDDPTTGTVGGLSQATNIWWRSLAATGLAPSVENQSLSIFYRNQIIQLKKRGGRPNKALVGTQHWDALMQEVQGKGIYTQTGFNGKTNDIGLQTIALGGLEFEIDHTLDDLGEAKSAYILDSTHLKLRPMEGEKDKMVSPARPYDRLVLLKSMLNTGALVANQLNGMAKNSIA